MRVENQKYLANWVGNRIEMTDVISAKTATLMQSILPEATPLATGDTLPPLWQWLYFHTPVPLAELGRDGHPKNGGFLPPISLPRRMWAGSQLECMGDLRIGEEITKRSTIRKVEPKIGKSGALCFVTVQHEFLRSETNLWTEQQDIVYREAAVHGQEQPAPVPCPQEHTDYELVTPSAVMLFRYSALTFNGHRIHYDRDYTREAEGYPDLVFHGPLTATLLADFALRKSTGLLRGLTCRAVSPLFGTEPFGIFLNRKPGLTTAWARTPSGGLGMQVEAVFA